MPTKDNAYLNDVVSTYNNSSSPVPRKRPNPTPKLLRIVNGKPHARAEDHEDQENRPVLVHTTDPIMIADDEVFADPKSSGGEEPERSSSPPSGNIPATQWTGKNKSAGGIRVPARGNATHNARERERRRAAGETDVAQGKPKPTASGKSAVPQRQSSDADELAFGMGEMANTSRTNAKKRKFGSTNNNIHAQKQTSYGKVRRNEPVRALDGSRTVTTSFSEEEQEDGPKFKHFSAKLNTSSDDLGKNVPTFKALPKSNGVTDHNERESGKKFKPPTKRIGMPDTSLEEEPGPQFRMPGSLEGSQGSQEESQTPNFKPPSPKTELQDISFDSLPGITVSRPESKPVQPRSNSSSPLSSPPSSIDSSIERTCPMCRQPLDPSFPIAYSTYLSRMNIRQQQSFCRQHKRHTAQREWDKHGYPSIDWRDLPKRLLSHRAYIEAVLDQSVPSHFRDQLAAKIATGRNRTLIQSVGTTSFDGLTPGYYGPRGSRIMMEFVTARFAARIRANAGRDRVMAASGGVSGYVQAVLVPELATRLVMEDLDCNDEDARSALEESRALGDLLCDDDEAEESTQAVEELYGWGNEKRRRVYIDEQGFEQEV